MKWKSLEVLFLDELADMYDCEIRFTRALPKMVRAATHAELREAFQNYLDETDNHVIRLKEVFESFAKSAKSKKCEAVDQLGNDDAADLLRQTLGEEKAADKTLTTLARLRCNESAQDGAPEEEDAPRIGRGRSIRPARNRARA